MTAKAKKTVQETNAENTVEETGELLGKDPREMDGYDCLLPIERVRPSKFARLQARMIPVMQNPSDYEIIADLLEFIENELVVDEEEWIKFVKGSFDEAMQLVLAYWDDFSKKSR